MGKELVREQPQSFDVSRPKQAEMAAIEGGELGFAEAFDDGEDSGVDEAHGGIVVAFGDLKNAVVVLGDKVFDEKVAVEDVL